MTLERLVVASKNPEKISEVEALVLEAGLAEEIVRGLDWPDVPETRTSLLGNALLKARTVAAATGLPALADDTGLEVEALDGAPGVMTARFAGPRATHADNVAKLLTVMVGRSDRRARFRTVVALVEPGGRTSTGEGMVEGRITRAPRGGSGFGYDPIFEVEGRTLAEMTDEEKNRISHRGLAIRALAEALRADD